MKKALVVIVAACLAFSSCFRKNKDDEDKVFGDPLTEFKKNIQFPAGSYTISSGSSLDPNIQLFSGPGGRVPIKPGQISGQWTFNDPNGNIVGAGMRFGETGDITVMPTTGAKGKTSGALDVSLTVGPSICANLSKICHDIKCYEFAVTADGKISQANITTVAMMCGNCDEPSCKPLMDPPCNTTTTPGNGTVTSSLASGTGTSFCSGGSLSVTTPSGWTLVASNVPSSGTVNFNDDYYNGSCTSCPAIQYSNSSGTAYIGMSGSGSWSGNTFSFNVTMKSIPDAVGGGGTSYNVSGSINCN